MTCRFFLFPWWWRICISSYVTLKSVYKYRFHNKTCTGNLSFIELSITSKASFWASLFLFARGCENIADPSWPIWSVADPTWPIWSVADPAWSIWLIWLKFELFHCDQKIIIPQIYLKLSIWLNFFQKLDLFSYTTHWKYLWRPWLSCLI